jgi:hypothetical protein
MEPIVESAHNRFTFTLQKKRSIDCHSERFNKKFRLFKGFQAYELDTTENFELNNFLDLQSSNQILAILNQEIFHNTELNDFSFKSFYKFLVQIFPQNLISKVNFEKKSFGRTFLFKS